MMGLADYIFRKRPELLCVRCTGSSIDKSPGAINHFCHDCMVEINRPLPRGWAWNDNFSGIYQFLPLVRAPVDNLGLSVGG